ncbi:MAG: ATP-dependent RNA helicase HrpA [Methylococcus sp.]|nr:MAG: ATP-dependent RNA helicase HrpA [Methylococcus sp.]
MASKHFDELHKSLNDCLSRDRHRFDRRLRKFGRGEAKGLDGAEELKRLETVIRRSLEARARRSSSVPKISYPDLPVSKRRTEIGRSILDHQVVILCGETGSGKTTQLPKICLSIGRGCSGLIGHTQPRRLAATTVARRIAQEMGQALGGLVGYTIRFQDRTSPQTLVKLMTDGILLAEIQKDPYLSHYDTLILDEAHERSLNIDFLLGYLKWLLPKRQDLKLVITSATIDPDRFSRHFDGAPVIQVSGRTYPVEIRYQPLEENENDEPDMARAIMNSVEELGPEGDILVFLSGEREIREAAEFLRRHCKNRFEVLPLFSRLNYKEQEKVFESTGTRRIVLSTNVAETSVTVPGIRYVIDTGLARISRYSYRSKIQRLPVERISQASAKQRSGRCGRLGPGVCIRLYSEEDFESRLQFTDPEIQRTNLASVILQMKSLGLGNLEDFPFMEAPDPRMVRAGVKLLEELNAIDSDKGLTGIGRDLARIPLDPRLGRMLIASREERCIAEIAIIASALSLQDPRERPAEKAQVADERHRVYQDKESDFVGIVNLWKALEEKKKELSNSKFRIHCRENFISFVRWREWRDIHGQLMQLVERELGARANEVDAGYESVHKALLAGLLSHVGFRNDQSEYLGARNLKFFIHPGSGLFNARPKWIMAAEQVETGRVYGRNVAKIQPEWIEEVGVHLVKLQHFEPHWQKRQGRAAIHESSVFFGLTLQKRRKIPYERIDLPAAREMFIRCALVEQNFNCKAAFFKHNRELLESLGDQQHKGRRGDLVADEEILFRFFDERLPDSVANGADFDRWRRKMEKTDPELLKLKKELVFGSSENLVDEEQYPDHMVSGSAKLQLDYRFEPGHPEDGVTAVIPVHQLNQLSADVFEWLVPGLLKEKVITLIRVLPKSVRRNFVPAAEYADRFLASAERKGSLAVALANFLCGIRSSEISVQSWSDISFSGYLRMHFRVVDENGVTVGSGRQLERLQIQLGDHSTAVFHQIAKQETLKSGCTRWDFGEIPRSQVLSGMEGETVAFPALVDEGATVGLQLFDSEELANATQEAGLVKLVMLRMCREIKYLKTITMGALPITRCYERREAHPFMESDMAAGYGALNLDLIQRIIRTVFFEGKPEIRTESAFNERISGEKHGLVETAESLSQLAWNILDLLNQVEARLRGCPFNPVIVADIREQLSLMAYKGFIARTPSSAMRSFPRYLKAILHRLEKAVSHESRDLQATRQLVPVWSSYWHWAKGYPRVFFPELDDYRWKIEEYRVSLFAQSLKTPYPVSRKRLEKIWAQRG